MPTMEPFMTNFEGSGVVKVEPKRFSGSRCSSRVIHSADCNRTADRIAGTTDRAAATQGRSRP